MTDFFRTIERTVTLDGTAWRESLPGMAYQGEQNAHRLIIRCVRDGAPLALTGPVLLKFLRADGVTVDVPGGIEDGAAIVTLPGSCYEVMGRAELTLFVTQDGATVALYAASAAVIRTRGEQEISGGDIIDLPALQAEYENMRAAVAAANAAADTASAAADAVSGDVSGLKGALGRIRHPADNVAAELTYTQGGFYRQNGDFIRDANWGYTDLIPVEANTRYDLNVPTSQYIVEYDSEKHYLSGTAATGLTTSDQTAYLRLSVYSTRQGAAALTAGGPYLNKADAVRALAAPNALVVSYVPGGYVNIQGVFVADANWSCSDFLPCSAGSLYFLNTTATGYLAFYGANRGFLSCANANRALSPDGAAFMRIGVRNARKADTIVTVGSPWPKPREEYVNVDQWQNGSVIDFNSGEPMGALGTFRASGFVDVSGYSALRFSGMGRGGATSTAASVAFYDADRQFISGRRYIGYRGGNRTVDAVEALPEGAQYARFTYVAAASDDYAMFYCYGRHDNSDAAGGETAGHIRFLVYGNSYSCDAFSYVPFILKGLGITCEIYNYVRDACSLRDVYNRWDSAAEYDQETDGVHAGVYQRFLTYIDTRSMNAWTVLPRVSMRAALAYGGWDFVSFQQWGGFSWDPESYEPWFSLIIDRVNQTAEGGTPIAWHEVWSRKAWDHPQETVETLKNTVFSRYPIDFILPSGTAIFNARQDAAISAVGAGGSLWAGDEIHLQDGLGCYIAACAVSQAICSRFFPGKSVLGDKTPITDGNVTAWDVPEPHLPVAGMTDENRLYAQKCAIAACNDPFAIRRVVHSPRADYAQYSAFPATGGKGVLYRDLSDGRTYTWDDSQAVYVLNEAP